MILSGRYRHYKGNDYEVIGIARHSETEEELVVYSLRLQRSLHLTVSQYDIIMTLLNDVISHESTL